MEKILCPIDFSETSLNALEFAINIGEKSHSQITLLNIFTESDFDKVLESEKVGKEYNQLIDMAEKKLKSIANVIKSEGQPKGLADCKFTLRSGNTVEVLKQFIEDENFNVIIIGTTGLSNHDSPQIGSRAVKIIEATRCDVICVPATTSFKGIKRIVYATDYQEEDKIAIQQVITFASLADAHIEVLHISHRDSTIDEAIFEDYMHEMRSFVQYEKLSFGRQIFNHVAEGLDEYMKSTNSDVLVLLDKKRNFFENLFATSLTHNLSHFMDYPFWVLKL